MVQRKMVWVELTPGTYVWRPKRSFWRKLQIAVERQALDSRVAPGSRQTEKNFPKIVLPHQELAELDYLLVTTLRQFRMFAAGASRTAVN